MVYELDWFLDLIFVIFVFLDYLSNLKYGTNRHHYKQLYLFHNAIKYKL